MASSPVIAPSSPPLNSTTAQITEKSSPPPVSLPPLPSPPPSSPASPPPSPQVSPPPASPPPISPPISPPPISPPPLSPPSTSPPLSSPPPLEASPPPPTPTSPPPSPPPTQSQSPPPPQISSPPPSPLPPANPDNSQSSPPPPFLPPPPSVPNTPPSPATSIPTPVIFSPPPPEANPNGQPPPAVVGKQSPPTQSSSHTAPTNKSPSPPASTRSFPPPSSSGSTAILVGVVVVAGILALVVAVFCILLFKRKKRQPYYMDHGRPPTGRDQYSPNWNSPMDHHLVKISPPPGVMVTPVVGVGAWGASPSPSPGVMVTPGAAWGATPPLQPQAAANINMEYTLNSAQHQQQYHFGGPLSPGGGGMGGFSKFQFTYEELAAATSGFAQVNLLGQGGFGYVHKGVLSDGKLVAVKSLKEGSGQGEREFQAEVEIITRVHHRHLVSLVGYCIVGNQRMLVYEFVSNQTLEYHLHGKGRPVMDWPTRLKIALGAAKGLAYLHEDCHPRIIHRDIKAANILLDDNNEAMVADFGLAKLTSDNSTHVSTRVMGTFGYLAPEYATSGKLTEKSDVFSFGVMLLELITGKIPVDPISKFMEDCLVDWARPRLTKAMEDGKYEELVDPGLEGKYVVQEMAPMISCAAASIRHSARRRPKMSQIARALDGDPSVDLNDGPKPTPNSSDPADLTPQTETYNTELYNADMMKFNKMVMSSNDFSSSEYGATCEYGNMDPSPSSTHHISHQQNIKT